MQTLALMDHELAYLLGAVGAMLQHPSLGPRDRNALLALRDRLASLVKFDDEVTSALGLDQPEQRH